MYSTDSYLTHEESVEHTRKYTRFKTGVALIRKETAVHHESLPHFFINLNLNYEKIFVTAP